MRRRELQAHSRCLLAGWLLMLLVPGPAAAQPPRATEAAQPAQATEYDLKLAFLYNFLRYVEWPPDAATGPLDVCVAGQNPFGATFFETLRGEIVNGRMVVPHEILSPEPFCDVIFIPRTARIRAYLTANSGRPVLLVGESPGFLEDGGIIRFIEEGPRLRFAIDVERAQRVGLRIDPQLLRLRVPEPGTQP